MFLIRLGLLGLIVVTCGCRVQTGPTLSGVAGASPVKAESPAKADLRGDLLNYETPLVQLISEKPLRKSRIALQVEKSRYRLTVLYRGKAVKSYPIVLGANPVTAGGAVNAPMFTGLVESREFCPSTGMITSTIPVNNLRIYKILFSAPDPDFVDTRIGSARASLRTDT